MYWYDSPESDKALKSIPVKRIEQIELHPQEEKVFFFLFDEKLYRCEAPTRDNAELWFKSL